MVEVDYSDLAIRILGPSQAQIFKVNGKFRYKIIAKFRDEKKFRSLISQSLIKYSECKNFSGVTTFVDVNPDSIL